AVVEAVDRDTGRLVDARFDIAIFPVGVEAVLESEDGGELDTRRVGEEIDIAAPIDADAALIGGEADALAGEEAEVLVDQNIEPGFDLGSAGTGEKQYADRGQAGGPVPLTHTISAHTSRTLSGYAFSRCREHWATRR